MNMKSYSWGEMEGWSKTELIERIRALEHELARPAKHRQKLDKNESK